MSDETAAESAAQEEPLPSVVLTITAHPDDVDFGMAATLATWADRGVEIVYCIVTDGDAGGSDRSMSRSAVAELRRAEQQAAADIVGAKEVRFLGYPDGRVEASLQLRADLSRVIREVRPDRLLTQSAQRNLERLYGSHPDHLAVGEAAICAVYPDARNPFAFPELLAAGLEPHTVPEVWLAGGPKADRFVDVTDAYPRKLAALAAHESQTGHHDKARFEAMLRGNAARAAEAAGFPTGRLAEMFRFVNTA